MKVSEKLKNKIKVFLENKSYDNCEFDDFLGEYFNNGNPTERLIFLDFKECSDIIDIFFRNFAESYNGMLGLFKNSPKKNSNKYKNLTIEQQNMLNKKEKFVSKMTKIYEDIRDNFGKELQEENQIFICPYCQRNYIGIFENKDSQKGFTAPDLDHFYPKSKYPFLSATISNLIPACLVCNQRLKNDKDTHQLNIPNPLENNIFEDINFDYNCQGPYIKNYSKLTNEKKEYLKLFKIQEQYSMHTEIVNEIQVKKNKYNLVKKKHLSKCCPSLNEKIIEDMVFHEYKYIDKRKTPLWKLKKDLFEKIKNESH